MVLFLLERGYFMYPKKVNLKIYQGSDYSVTLKIKNNDQIVNCSSWTVNAVARRSKMDRESVFAFQVTKGNGFIILSIPANTTKRLELGGNEENLYYDVLVVGDNRESFYLVEGKIKLVKSITNGG